MQTDHLSGIILTPDREPQLDMPQMKAAMLHGVSCLL